MVQSKLLPRALAGAACLAGLAGLAAIRLPACTGAPEPAAPQPQEKVVVIAAQADVVSLNPVTTTDVDSRNIIANLQLPMYQFHFDCGLVAEPGLASRWAWTADGTTLRVELRDDVTWSDGAPVTADDVAFTYGLMADPAVASPYASMLRHLSPDARPRVIDAHTLEWGFTHSYDRMSQLAATSAFLVPKHVLDGVPAAQLRSHPYNLAPLSTGPWAWADHEQDVGWSLRPNAAFTGPADLRPHLDRVAFRVLPDTNTRKLALLDGSVDVLAGLTGPDARELAQRSGSVQIHARGQRRLEMIALNPKVPPLDDPEVRRGLAAALDIDRMLDVLHRDADGAMLARRATGPISPLFCHAYDDRITPIASDPERARAALARAGWRDTNGDGYVDREGKELRLELLFSSEHEPARQIAEMSRAALAAVGVDLVLDAQPKAMAVERRQRRDYQVAYAANDTGLFLDLGVAWRTPEAPDAPSANVTGYSNKAVDILMEFAMAEQDPVQANAYWRELQRVVYDDQPVIFLWWSSDLVATSSRITGTSIDVISALHDLQRWDLTAP